VIRTKLVRIVGTLVVLSLVPPVYAADKFPDYPVRQAGEYAVTAERAGLTIGVQPVEDPKDQKTYFSTVLTAQGFLPVFIVLQNGSSADSFLFDKTGVTYGPADSSLPATPKPSEKAAQGVAIGSGLALSPAGMFVAAHLIGSASVVRQNILKKEVQSKTLSSGVSTYGFLYVPVPKNAPRQKTRLRIPITRAGTDESFVLDLVF
jgi:hypothetical protein